MGILVPLLLVWIVAVLANHGVMAKNTFAMDTQEDCGQVGLHDVQRDQTITVSGRSTGSIRSTQGSCTISFRTVDSDANIELEFLSFFISSCDVSLYLRGDGSANTDSYSCQQGTSLPRTYYSLGRSITITLHKKDPNTLDYNFEMRIIAKRDDQYPPPDDSNPMATGLVIGIVGLVFGLIFIVVCVGVCCFRKYRVGGSSTKSPYLYDTDSKSKLGEERSHTSVGYTNESLRDGGTGHGSPASKKKLLARSDSSSDEKADPNYHNRPNTLNLRNKNAGRMNNRSNVPAAPPLPQFDNNSSNPKSSNFIDEKPERGRDRNFFDYNEKDTNRYKDRNEDTNKNRYKDRNEDKDTNRYTDRNEDKNTNGKGVMLNALESNAKFRRSFSENEADAEKRAKRISASSGEKEKVTKSSQPSDDNHNPPKLPAVPRSPKSPKSKHARIKRTPRPTSVSSEELAQIERGRMDSDDDPNIRVVKDESVSSSSEIVPIKVNANDNDDKMKANTTHSLKPNRKGPQGRKKQTQSVSSALDPEPKPVHKTQRDRVASTDGVLNESFETQGSGRYSKRPSKSPKSRIRGFGHRRGRRDDQNDSRPTTPTSAFGSMEDLESLPPLGRHGSKSSLYSSRSSLYDRRGNRRRKGSYPESEASSYSRDDIGVMRHSREYNNYYDDDDENFDGYEKPLSRRDRERMYRSDTNIGRTVSTQTLRETATQTGPDASVSFEKKLITKKKRLSRSMSSSGTQTGGKKASGDGKTKTKAGEPSSPKAKTKRSKSENITDDMKRAKSMEELDTETIKKSSKPKPKAKPRKSTSADSILDSKGKSASQENLADNPYYPKSEGFAVEGYPGQGYPGYPAYPNVVPPGYPGMQYQGQPGMPYPPPPNNVQVVAPGYPQPPITNVLPSVQPTREPRKPKKSNWEMLVDLTEGEYQDRRGHDDVTETGSVASSVFTNNPHDVQGYGMPAGNQAYYPPPPAYQPQQFGYQPAQQYVQNSKAEPQRAPNVSAGSREEAIRKKSSWEALEELTGPQGQKPPGNSKTETVI